MSKVDNLIKQLQLLPHPEGGYYRETYRSEISISKTALPSLYGGDRSAGTAIYYLLKSGQRSLLHKIVSDELWHFYDGSPLVLAMIFSDGKYEEKILGNNVDEGEVPQIIIKGGTWFGAYPKEDNTYSLAGCTVHPGFDFEDFEMAGRSKLLSQFPHLEDIIKKLTGD